MLATETVELKWLAEFAWKTFVVLHELFGTVGLVLIALTAGPILVLLVYRGYRALVAFGKRRRWFRIVVCIIALLLALLVFGRIGYYDCMDGHR
ncbi:MAG: hypothetical protein PHO92_04560 [Candidatus Peribacteraceae bacterium]|nr:hypothetical protein [Candidatus Peribacteraceae bacterium]